MFCAVPVSAELYGLVQRSLEIIGDDDWPIQADGDDLGVLPVRLGISDKRLKLL